MSKRELLEKAGILEKDESITPEAEKKIEQLSEEDIEFLIKKKQEIKEKTGQDMMIAPPTHHF